MFILQVFKRWDMALYEEAMSVKEVGKPEYSARCESIASEIFPVEQQVLSAVILFLIRSNLIIAILSEIMHE